ncbi:MAG TPA: 1,4-alpha-glucan branching enzyme, partial [Candidatus Dormibacteraeota bacterium]
MSPARRGPADGTASPALPDISAAAARLLAGEHHEPHRVLGAHPLGTESVVRALHPTAERCTVIWEGGEVPLDRGDGGLFQGRVPTAELTEYRLRFDEGERSWVIDDPYRFLPTLGDLDLHLIREGQHRELWRRLGARVIEHQGVIGTAFAVWAPNARSVRLVSDAGYWDDRLHMLRSLGSSGVWELFLPGVGAGCHYKVSITGADGRRVLKADPLARAAETPPATASVVDVSQHRWADDEWIAARAA